jgi:glycine betaine/proline transport system ATP-binding protein
MGLSGSGKSTLVRCINRLIEPTSGSILIDDEDVTKMNHKQLLELRRHKLGMVFQNFALFPHRTVLENAEYGLEVMGVDQAERAKKAHDALELVGLKGWEHQIPGELSGGMQQRVGLARALAVDPEIILMDEALSALDPLIRKDMQGELIDLQRKLDKTIIFITHDLDEALNMGDRIVLMKDGLIVQTGTAEDILTNPASRYVERFVEDVEKYKVMSADSIMKKVGEVAYPNDGPRTVMHKIKNSGHSNIFAVDAHGVLQGVIRVQKLDQAIKEGKKNCKELIEPNVPKTDENTPLTDILPMMTESQEPIAVINKENKLKGVIVIGSLLAGLSEGTS